jgi:AcrR family transcriptional regulator
VAEFRIPAYHRSKRKLPPVTYRRHPPLVKLFRELLCEEAHKPVKGTDSRPMRADARRNRERLLEVAADAFARDGADASLEEIARQAGVGIGTLYRNFPSREALMEMVFRRNVDQLVTRTEQLMSSLPPDEALAAFMEQFVAYVATKRGLATHLKTVLSADAELFVYTHSRIHEAISTLIKAAVESGRIRADAEPDDVLRALSGVCLASDASGSQDQACRISR